MHIRKDDMVIVLSPLKLKVMLYVDLESWC